MTSAEDVRDSSGRGARWGNAESQPYSVRPPIGLGILERHLFDRETERRQKDQRVVHLHVQELRLLLGGTRHLELVVVATQLHAVSRDEGLRDRAVDEPILEQAWYPSSWQPGQHEG